MRDALLRFAFAAEADKGFALEVEEILFADILRGGERASGKNVGEFAGDVSVIFADIFAAKHHVNGELGGGEKTFAEDADFRSRGAFFWICEGGTPIGAGERERGLFGVGDETIAIHGNGIGAAKISERASFFGAGADLCESDVVEARLKRVEKV